MKKILVIEGMGNFPAIQNQLIKPMMAKHPGRLDPTYRPWNVALGLGTDYIDGFDIVASHSLGGGAAVEIAKRAKNPIYITLDARRNDNVSWLDVGWAWRSPLTAPKGVAIHNFIHTPNFFFPGYKIDGAVENTSVLSTHMNLPGTRPVFDCLERLIT